MKCNFCCKVSIYTLARNSDMLLIFLLYVICFQNMLSGIIRVSYQIMSQAVVCWYKYGNQTSFSTITWINRKTNSWNHSCTLNCNTMRLLKSFTLTMSKPSNYKKETNSTVKTKWRTIPKFCVRWKPNIPSKRHIFKACNI